MYYDGTMMTVNHPTTTLTFTAPSVPDGMFNSTLVVRVSATSRYGIGPASEHEAILYGKVKFKILMMYVHKKEYVSEYENILYSSI